MITRETNIEDIVKEFHKVMCSCGAVIGEYHNDNCDIARCRKCGDQAWVSDCGKWKPDVWTGWWPGTIECIELDLWVNMIDPGQPGNEKGRYIKWEPCEADHPNARVDLNRLYSVTVWDKKRQKRVLP